MKYFATFNSNFSIPLILNFILQDGVTLLLINLSNETHFLLSVDEHMTVRDGVNKDSKSIHMEASLSGHLKKAFSFVGTKGSDVMFREEYHLTAKDDYLRSKTMLLNGNPIELTSDGEIPTLAPVSNHVHAPIYITPVSIAFIVFPNFDAPACAGHR